MSSFSLLKFVALILALSCFFEAVVGQTFHYSHGWTNGKKRSNLPPKLGSTDELMAVEDLAFEVRRQGQGQMQFT